MNPSKLKQIQSQAALDTIVMLAPAGWSRRYFLYTISPPIDGLVTRSAGRFSLQDTLTLRNKDETQHPSALECSSFKPCRPDDGEVGQPGLGQSLP